MGADEIDKVTPGVVPVTDVQIPNGWVLDEGQVGRGVAIALV